MRFKQFMEVRDLGKDDLSFIREFFDDKFNVTSLLVWSDWLEERGDPLNIVIRSAAETWRNVKRKSGRWLFPQLHRQGATQYFPNIASDLFRKSISRGGRGCYRNWGG